MKQDKDMLQEKGLLTAKDCFFMAMGATIGAGIITNTGIAIGITGTGVVLAYMIAFFLWYVGHFPLIIMTSLKPVYSCHYVYTKWVSEKLAGAYIYVFLIGRVSQAFMGIAFGTYLASITDIPVKWGAIGVLTVLYLVNLIGVKNSARAQNILTILLITALASFIFLGLPQVNPEQFFEKQSLLLNGWRGLFNAVAILLFGVGGAFLILPLGPQIKDPANTIPKVVTLAQFCACMLFCLIAFVGSGVGKVAELAGHPMTYQARIIYPGNWYLVFVIGGALLAIITTINANYIYYYTSTIKGCEDGWLPRFLAKQNRFGVPGRLLTLFWLMAVVPILCNMQIGQLAGIAAALTLAQAVIPLWGIVKLPELYPEEWKASKFYMPTWALWVMIVFCTSLILLFVVLNFMTFSKTVTTIFSVLLVLSFVVSFGFGDLIKGKRAIAASANPVVTK